MPIYNSGFDQGSGVLSASLQGDALAGGPGLDMGMDLGGIVGAVLAERRRAEAAKAQQLRQAQQQMMRAQRPVPQQGIPGGGPYGPQSGFQEMQRVQNFRRGLDSDRTAAQRASSAVGGVSSTAFGDSARQAQALQMGGFQPYEYTGMRDIVMGNSAASGEAQRGASNERMQGREQEFARESHQDARQQSNALRRRS